MAKAFLDTNVIVYANDDHDTRKRDLALELLARHVAERTGVISTQVCMEYVSFCRWGMV